MAIHAQRWALKGEWRIARGSRRFAETVTVELRDGLVAGRGECLPYARYGESIDSVTAQLEALKPALEAGLERDELQGRLPAGAARNAVDCALWDLAAKSTGQRVWQLVGLSPPKPLISAYTLAIDSPEAMAAAAKDHTHRPLLKVKLAGDDADRARVAAVHTAVPEAQLIIDANESWTPSRYLELAPSLAELGVVLIEQPLPADRDAPLAELPHPVPVCADESCHTAADLERLAGRYDVVNLKLDKTGGLTAALELRAQAQQRGFELMVGCMMATSLAMAPAFVVAGEALFVDLDAPLWLAEDRTPKVEFRASELQPPPAALWG
ncbi:MAG: N-acetyl-D-Glu racemase DgcA [Candidatus Competibacterales bacterium]